MTKLSQDRIIFVEQLHDVFFIKKGYGAFAFISVADAMSLFEKYQASNQSAHLFINAYVSSI